MGTTIIQVPVSLLLDAALPAPAKLIQMARTLGPADLELRTGLSRPTIRKWLAVRVLEPAPDGATVNMPLGLLADRRVGVQAKLLYGVLQVVPGGQTTYAGQQEGPALLLAR